MVQDMPEGELLTDPLPDPDSETCRGFSGMAIAMVCVACGAGLKLALPC